MRNFVCCQQLNRLSQESFSRSMLHSFEEAHPSDSLRRKMFNAQADKKETCCKQLSAAWCLGLPA